MRSQLISLYDKSHVPIYTEVVINILGHVVGGQILKLRIWYGVLKYLLKSLPRSG